MQLFIGRVSIRKQFKLLLFATFLIFPAALTAQAQTTFVRITVVSVRPARVNVEIGVGGASEWSFRNASASIVGLAERIENFHGDYLGRDVPVTRLAPGEFRFGEKVTRVIYDVQLTPPSNQTHLSHVSWISEEHGLLMLRDLLPEAGMGSAPLLNLNLMLPPQWKSASSFDSSGTDRYVVMRPERAVVLIGRSLRINDTKVGASQIIIVTSGDWSFRDRDLSKIVTKIIEAHSKVMQHSPPGNVALLLVPFNEAIGPDRWSAETTGNSVVLMLGRQASGSTLLGRLKVVLSHELFHLWIPNGVSLKGDYDWFFEGFTLYQALLTALRLHYIKFDDYLETLGRVWDSYRSLSERDKLSLLEASERRWTTASSLVYDKGMLVAFVYDLMLRQNSGNRSTMSDLYSGLLRTAIGSQREANELLLETLDRQPGMQRFSEQFVSNTSDIELAKIVKSFGLELTTNSMRSRIEVSKNLTPQQREVLKGIGYK